MRHRANPPRPRPPSQGCWKRPAYPDRKNTSEDPGRAFLVDGGLLVNLGTVLLGERPVYKRKRILFFLACLRGLFLLIIAGNLHAGRDKNPQGHQYGEDHQRSAEMQRKDLGQIGGVSVFCLQFLALLLLLRFPALRPGKLRFRSPGNFRRLRPGITCFCSLRKIVSFIPISPFR